MAGLGTLALAGALLCAGCSDVISSQTMSRGADGMAKSEAISASDEPSWDSTTTNSSASDGGDVEASEADETRRIYDGSLALDTTAFDDTVAAVRDAAGEGYVDSEDMRRRLDDRREATLVLRVPEATFTDVMERLRGLAGVYVQSDRVSTQDVTEQTLTLESELEVARQALTRLQGLLEAATTVDEQLSVLDRIDAQEREVARLEDAIEFYDDATTYSRITVTVREVDALGERANDDFGSRVLAAVEGGGLTFVGLVAALVLLVIGLWPVLLVAGVIIGIVWWRKRKTGAKAARDADAGAKADATPKPPAEVSGATEVSEGADTDA